MNSQIIRLPFYFMRAFSRTVAYSVTYVNWRLDDSENSAYKDLNLYKS